MDRATATTNAEELRAFAGEATGKEAPDGVDFVATAAAATNTSTVGTETTQNTKRKREENHGGRTNTNTDINNHAKASNLEKAAATEEGGHNLNLNGDVPLPQLQAVLRDDADDDDEEEVEDEEEIDEDNDDEEVEGGNCDDGDNDDEEEEEGGDTDEEDDDSDDNDVDNDNNDDGSSIESVVPVVPTPDDVELEYTYPQDFVGRRWAAVVRWRYFRLIIDPSCADIAERFFHSCEFLIEVIFRGNTLTRIRRRAFMCCWNLQRINAFPKTLEYLEVEVFRECPTLEIHLVIPKGCVLVGESCFEACSRLISVVFEEPTSPEHVLEIRRLAFYKCRELRSVRLPKNLRSIPGGCFCECTELTDIPLPQSLRELGGLSFSGCTKLTSIDLPESIHLLGMDAYSSCRSLESITIRCASSNIEFGGNVFQGCLAVSTIRMYPWLYPKLFEAMEEHPRDFLYKFVRESQYQLERYRFQQS